MKHSFSIRTLSFVLALVLVLGMIPVNASHVHVHAAEVETKSVTNEDTYLELDYDKPPYKVDDKGNPVYDENGKLIYLEPELALSEEAESNRTVTDTYSNGKAMDFDYYWSADNTDQWRQVFKGDAKASGGSFRKWMESTDPDDQYIVLMEDMKINVGSSSDWETIVITSDKVLDLNGHTLEFYDQRNGTKDQNTGYYKHASKLFEINNNARLTVIDSGGVGVTQTATNGEISSLVGEQDTGRIYANGYMINHQKWDFWFYTHRDIFHVVSGDLVIYGGEYQAGRQKDQVKSNFSWNNLKEVIGDAVALGVAVYEYATGIEGEFAKRADILDIDMYENLREEDNEENKDDTKKGSEGTSKKKDGTGGTEEKKTDTPASKGNAGGEDKKKDQTVAQKKTEDNKKKDEDKKGDKSKDNKAEEGKDAKPAKKDPENSKIAEANKAIGNAFLDKDKISAMYDTAVKFGEGLYNLFGSDENTRATACIHGTVARVADNCTLVIYGGKFIGYGSTPNVRNAVIEVSHNRATNGVQTSSDPRYGRTQGGAVYVFDGSFTAMAGANVFNMYIVNRSENLQASVWTVQNGVKTETKVPLLPSETFGLEIVTYENVTYNGVTQAMPVDTGNIMVRGGTFQCYFEPTMMATLNPATKGTDKNDGQYCPEHDKYGDDCDDVDHNKFSGTVGSVNLGVQSFDEDMIRDGRIQLVDVYGSGRLVLLDGGDPIDPNPEDDSGKTEEEILAEEQKAWDDFVAGGGDPNSKAPTNTYTTNITKAGGIRKYRLFISDVELRALEYLTVHPNTAITNSTESFALQTYYGTPTDRNPKVTQPWVTDDENIRAPYSSNEGYFEFEFDDPGYSEGIFISPDLKLNGALLSGEELAQSPVWYYTIPVNAAGESLGDFSYTDTYLRTKYSTGTVEASFNRTRMNGSPAYSSEFYWGLKDFVESNTEYYKRTEQKYSTNIKFFVYKIYRVDPLSRESINESDEWSANEPLLELRYGANNDSVKCIVTLKELEKAIEKRLREKGEIGANESWSYRSGDLFRIVFSVEERLGYGYTGSQTDGEVKFLNELAPASAEASILIRCVSKNEDKDSYHYNPSTGAISAAQVADWTPLQFVSKDKSTGRYVKNENLVAGDYATVELINGQTGMVDWQGARIFDIYYQWYLMDDPEDETPTLIAGTDNVWIAQNPYGSKQFHKPDNFLLKEDGSYLGINGEHYANTVDPNSPEATMYTYGPNGLPVNTEDVKHSPDLWTNEMLHMYTYETANSEPGMKKYNAEDIAAGRAPAGTKDRIYLANNNTFWGNTDSVYIPTQYAGKYLMCKMVAVNVRYPHLYDNLQTIYSHVIKIDGPSLPEFDTITPEVTDTKLEAGVTNLGMLTEPPTFAFTYQDLEQKYYNAGYRLDPAILILLDGEASGVAVTKDQCAEGVTIKKFGNYEITMSLVLTAPNGTEVQRRSMTYKFMLTPVKPTFTTMKPTPTADELAAGITELGALDEPIEFGFTYDYEMPDWVVEQGYQLSGIMEIYTNGVYQGTAPDPTSWTPSGFGERMVVYKLALYDAVNREYVSNVTHTYTFTLTAPGLAFKTMTPAVTDKELTAGVTDLGTIDGSMPYFGFYYENSDLPAWMLDAGYHLDGSMIVKRDGAVIEERGSASYQPAKRVGDYEIIYKLNLLDRENEVIGTISHTYTLTVPQGEAQYLTVTTPDRYFKGEIYTLTCAVGPSTASQEVTWQSSNPAVATISADGILTCLEYGETTITVATADESIAKSFEILVTNEGVVYIGGVGLNKGEYLAQGSTTPTTTKPDDNYVYLQSGTILQLHNFSYYGKHTAIDLSSSGMMSLILSGENRLDMEPSRDLSYSYEYYNAEGILSEAAVIIRGTTKGGSLTFAHFTTGIDVPALTLSDSPNLYFEESDTATDICVQNFTMKSGNVVSKNGLYFSAASIISGGAVSIETSGVALYSSRSLGINGGANVRIVSTDRSAMSLSSGTTIEVNGGNLYVEGVTEAIGSSQTVKMYIYQSEGAPSNVLLLSTAEGEPQKGARDSLYSAVTSTATINYQNCYAYGSTERFGTNGETYVTENLNTYDFLFIGMDPRVFNTSVYVDPTGTVEWDGTTDLRQCDNVQIVHKHTLEYVAEIPATCTETGVCGYYYCSECRKMYADEACTTEITNTTLDALDHDWMYNTCTEPRHCVRCGLVDERYPASGHSWYPATCTNPMMCRWCDAVMGAPIDHNWVEADCWMGEHCDMCYEEISDPLGHILEGELIIPEWAKINCSWGIEVQQWCARCEEYVWIDLEPDPNAHSWVGGDCENPAQCEYCEAYSSDVAGHNWSEATCTTPATCTVCGAANGTASGHVWEDATCAHPKLCINCGTTEGSALAHSWKDATCDDPKTCTVCWATEGDALGHTWDVTDCTKERTCTVCGEARAAGSHDLTITSTTDKQHTGTCDECGMSVTENHTFDSTNTCTVCGASKEDNVDPSIVPTMTGKSFTLSFEDEILVNFYYTVSDTTDVVEHGMLVFYENPAIIDIADADAVYNEPVYDSAKDRYMATSDGIAAKEMGDTRYYVAYAKLYDGTYAYSKAYDYSPKKYSMNMLGKDSTSAKQKALCVAMLNYGAAAQTYFGYNTDNLMNAELTAEQKAMNIAYDETLFKNAVAVDPAKIGAFGATATGFSKKTATVSFEGAFLINYYFTPNVAVNGNMTLYIWTPEDYAAATTLTAENAIVVPMVAGADGRHFGQVEGIAAKALDDTYYVAGVYTDANGNTYCTGIIAYSLSKYCINNAKPGKDMQELASATAMYGYYAKLYFTT